MSWNKTTKTLVYSHLWYRCVPWLTNRIQSEHLFVSWKYKMRWNIHPSVGQKGFKYVVFLSRNNTNRVSSINAKKLKQIVVKYITIQQ